MNDQAQSSGSLFGEYYYAHNCGQPYAHSEAWLAFFDRVAARIIADFNPRTVLDAGCAWGLLVERLRARGVEAYGIDLSEFAIQKVHPDIRDYCFVGSITEPFPQRYDLIISIEVLEHMPPADSERAIENLCKHSDNIMISSTPFDYKEATHLNVQAPDYWARQFARHRFFRDLDYDATTYLTPWAVRFYHEQTDSVQPVVQAYERRMWQLQAEIKDLRASVLDYHQKLQGSEQQVAELRQVIELLQKNTNTAESVQQTAENERQISQLRLQVQELEARWADLQQGRGWKMMQKIQSLRVGLFPIGSKREQMLDRLIVRDRQSKDGGDK